MHAFELRLLKLAGQQHYVVTHDQLREFGSNKQIVSRQSAGLFESVHGSVYRIVGSPATWRQELMTACLATSGVSAASFRSAAQMWSLPGGEELVEVSGPRHDRTQYKGIRTHESFFLTDLDVTYIDSIPVTRPARVICDLGLLVKRGEMSVETLELAMHEAFRRDLLDVTRVSARVGTAWSNAPARREGR